MFNWSKFAFPVSDARKVGQWAFNKLKPPTEDIKTVGKFAFNKLSSAKSPFETRRKTGEWAFNKLRTAATDYFKPTAEVRRRDVWREMPSTGTKMLKLGTTMREEMAKSGGSLGLSLMNIFNDLQGKKRVSAFKPREDAPKIERGIHQFVFGKEPVKSIERRIFEGEKTARKIGEEYGIKSMEKYPLAFSAVGVGAIISLDFTGFGGGKKQAVKLIAKMDDVADISKLLRQAGVAEDLVLPTAKKMKTIKSEVQILNALDKIEVLQKSTKIKLIRQSDKFLETMRRPKEEVETGIIKHIKEHGGVTVDFTGKIKNDGYAFSILDKTDEVSLTMDKNFDTMFIKTFNSLKNKYGGNKDAYFGGWTENEKFISDVVYQSNDLKQSLYEGILKRQTAVGDLAKYGAGKDGTINISKEIVNSIEPLSRGSIKASKTIFKNWDEVKAYYSAKNYKNTSEINSEVISKLRPAKAGFVVPKKPDPLITEARKYKSAEEFFLRSKQGREMLREKGIKSQEAIKNWFNKNITPKKPTLDNLNPTGSLYVDYTPKQRMTMKLGDNITTLDKTSGKSADEIITIYRGAPKIQKEIVAGDFITTNYDLAKSYAGEGNVLQKKVKMGDVLDDITEPLGEEYIYRPAKAIKAKPITEPDPLITEARKYKSAEEFVKAKQKDIVYHGSNQPLEKFDKRGAFFTDDMMNAEGYAGGENVYEGYLNLKNPLVIDAKGRHHSDLKTPYGKSTQEIVGKVDDKKYDGVIFKNINDSFADDVDIVGTDTIFYPFNANKSFINESQLTDIYNKAKIPEVKKGVYTKLLEKKLLTTPDIAGKGFVMRPTKKRGFTPATQIKREVAKSVKEAAEKKVAVEALKITKKGLSGFDNFIDITKIKKKAIPYKEMNIAENIVGDKTFPAIRKSGFYADKEIQFATVRDIYNQKLSPHLMALKQDGYKLGGKFGTVFSKVWKPTEKAIRVEKEFNSKNVKVILDLGKKYKIKATKKNLEYLSDVVEKKVKGTPNEELYVKELRKTLDGLREEANVVREAMGKNRMGYIENYIPHIQKANIWSELLANKATISDNLDFIIPNQTKNPFAYKRMLEEMVKPERNLYTLLDRYIGVIGKDIYYTPAIENIKAYNGVLKSREKIKAAQYWDEYIRQGLVGKQHKIDTALGIGVKGKRVLQKWNDMVNKAFLTGKVAWNIATQPLSYISNVPKEAGFRNSVKGIYKGFNKPLRQYVKENSNVLNIKSSDVHAIAVGEGRGIQNRIYRTKIDKWNDFISMIGSVEERELTLSSYIAGLERAKGFGYKGDDALWFADLTAARTQSMYNRENRALILNSDITRTIFPFSSYNIEMFNYVQEIFTKSGGAYQFTTRQRVGQLFSLMVGVYLANKYSEVLTGKKKTTIGTFVPFLGGTVIDPRIAKMKGEQYYGGRSPITVIQIGDDIIKGSQDYIKHGSTKRLRKIGVNFGLALGGMGGGGQINNLIDGIMANIDEDVKNVKGDVMFEVKDLESKIKAPIFGVWATKEGIEYWKPKEKTSYDKAVSEDKEKDKEAREKIKPIYNEIQKLKETDYEKAKELANTLSEEDREVYKKIKTAEKTKETNRMKEELYPMFLKIQELKKTDYEEARRLANTLTKEERRIYELLKAQLE